MSLLWNRQLNGLPILGNGLIRDRGSLRLQQIAYWISYLLSSMGRQLPCLVYAIKNVVNWHAWRIRGNLTTLPVSSTRLIDQDLRMSVERSPPVG